MSVKHYCDICKQEIIGSPVHDRIKALDTSPLSFEIICGYPYGTSNDGDICCSCLLREILNSFIQSMPKDDYDAAVERIKITRLTEKEFEDLPEYSRSLPTGITIGKRWKRNEDDLWYMGEYIDCDPPKEDKYLLRWTRIRVLKGQGE